MDKNMIKQLAAMLADVPAAERRELVERAMLIANGCASFADIDSFSFDWTGTYNEPGRRWADGRWGSKQ